MSGNTWRQLHVTLDREQADEVTEQLTEWGASAVTLQDAADEAIFEPTLGETPLWPNTKITGLFSADIDTGPLADTLQTQFSCECLEEALVDQVWERAWMDHFKPLCFGNRLWICPSWHTPPAPEQPTLMLDPGLAFGTGTHPTTALCLDVIARLDCQDKTVIDYGCGSGILGLAALKLGAKMLYGVDHDPQALLASKENAKLNQIHKGFLQLNQPDEGDIPVSPLIFANILAEPLINLAPKLLSLLAEDGQLLLSGLLEKQTLSVIDAYAHACDFEEKYQDKGWICLLGKKKSG